MLNLRSRNTPQTIYILKMRLSLSLLLINQTNPHRLNLNKLASHHTIYILNMSF
ncbi:hypothetical protein Lalb_Chr22g0357961 [Lupinus albus]|uniref:Uncharacterized protein n=1 Tax=Lupinus albus TaxID=3870 RepID=A0A6A4ND34_LUPAL|nr:hypothetical protein Lalb_Chr22g0357961 [Lupinus albus]